MKIYVIENRILLVGKGWEIREKLRQYSAQYKTVEEWVKASKK